MTKVRRLKINVSDEIGKVSSLLLLPESVSALLVLSHGAGAGMEHAFMERASSELETRSIASLRFNFPYIEQGKKGPNPAGILQATIGNAVEQARSLDPGLPILAGGKSMGVW